MWKWLLSLFNSRHDPIQSIFKGIDSLVTSDEEIERLKIEALKIAIAKEQMYLDDKARASNMYNKDSSMQKIYAIVFLIGYLALSYYILQIYIGEVAISEVGSNFIYAIWGGFSSTIAMITSFFFGSSAEGNSQAKLPTDITKDKGIK